MKKLLLPTTDSEMFGSSETSIYNSTATIFQNGEFSYATSDHLPNTTTSEPPSDDLVSDQARVWFQWTGIAVVCQGIDIFGTVTNIINIICFIKQGFKDPVNVSLLGLAISDLGCLVTLIFLNLNLTPVFQQADLPFDAFEFQYLTAGWPHVVCARITSWITALITLERCICITMPLKVKAIVTPRRVFLAIVCIFIFLICSVSPVYAVNKFAMKFYPKRNKTILGLVYTNNRENVEKIAFAVYNVFVPFTAFIIVLICTVTLVVKLQRKRKWRETASAQSISNRDQKVAKMVVMISALFIGCFTPVCIIFVAMTLKPEFSIDGRYKNIFIVVFGFSFILESTNSSLNIFIYYYMSSKYRAVFRHFFYISDAEDVKG